MQNTICHLGDKVLKALSQTPNSRFQFSQKCRGVEGLQRVHHPQMLLGVKLRWTRGIFSTPVLVSPHTSCCSLHCKIMFDSLFFINCSGWLSLENDYKKLVLCWNNSSKDMRKDLLLSLRGSSRVASVCFWSCSSVWCRRWELLSMTPFLRVWTASSAPAPPPDQR